MIGDRVLFAAADGSFALVDGHTGALRWRGAPAEGVRWRSLAATADAAVALGSDAGATWLRAIDLSTGASIDREVGAQSDHVLAVGPVLAVSDGCHLGVVGPDGATLFAARGRTGVRLGDDAICAGSALLVAADDTSATIVHFVDAQPQIDRVDRRTGAVLATLRFEVGASVAHEPLTGLILVTAPAGSVLALRPGPGDPVSRTWTPSTARALELRGVHFKSAPPLLLVRDGRRWTAVDATTLAERWTRTSDATVVLFGEATTSPEAAFKLARAGALRWLDPRDGAPIARRLLFPGMDETTLHGERVVVEGSGGTLALDVRSGAIRWATLARVASVMPDGLLAVRDPGTTTFGLVDAEAGSRRLTVELPGAPLARIPGGDGDLLLVMARVPPLLAAYADDEASARPLGVDPIEVFAPPCGDRHTSIVALEGYLACHPNSLGNMPFAAGDSRLPATASPRLDRLAREWRSSALQVPNQPGIWPQILVRGQRSAAEPPQLADRRAAAIRDALIERGVPCSAVYAAGRPGPGRPGVELTWIDSLGCLL